jgi:hypothetical protein
MKVSLKHTKNNKQGKLSKASRPGLRDDHSTKSKKWIIAEKIQGVVWPSKYRETNTNQKSDLNISSKGVAVLGKKSSWTTIIEGGTLSPIEWIDLN